MVRNDGDLHNYMFTVQMIVCAKYYLHWKYYCAPSQFVGVFCVRSSAIERHKPYL